MFKLINATEQANLRAKIEQLETQTSAEVVAVLQDQADSYRYIPSLWAAVVALSLPFWLPLLPFWLDASMIPNIQVLCFAALALLFQFTPIKYRLVPKSVKHRRAALSAREVFLDLGLHSTKDNTGVMLFVSEAEHYVEILVDHGVQSKIDSQQWQLVIERFTAHVKAGNAYAGFEDAIEGIGSTLKAALPWQDNENELPDHLVVITNRKA